jgi:hypothetical protein
MAQSIREFPAYVSSFFRESVLALEQTAENIRKRLAEGGKPVQRPIRWDSERQQRAFFASGGFERGIPYQRTHHLAKSLRLDRHPLGTRLYIPHPGGAVFGLPDGWQSSIHRGTWPHLLTVIFEELAKLPTEISNRISVMGNVGRKPVND